ncbi:unnamed protein product [Heterosigma akashiwo]
MIAELQGKKNRSSKRRSRKSKQAQGSTNNSGTATPTELHAQNGAAIPAAVAMSGHGGGGEWCPHSLTRARRRQITYWRCCLGDLQQNLCILELVHKILPPHKMGKSSSWRTTIMCPQVGLP